MSINGSLVADMKGIKIKRKRLDYWERIPEQNIGDTNLKKKKRKRFDIKVFKIKKAIGEKKTQKSASCFAWSAIDLTHKETTYQRRNVWLHPDI